MIFFEKKEFKTAADMLLFALEKKLIAASDVFKEFLDMEPEDVVQIVLDYGDINYICDCLLDYEISKE